MRPETFSPDLLLEAAITKYPSPIVPGAYAKLSRDEKVAAIADHVTGENVCGLRASRPDSDNAIVTSHSIVSNVNVVTVATSKAVSSVITDADVRAAAGHGV